MNPEKTIKKNLLRRSAFIDNELVIHKGVPLPTWIELSLIDVCNRSCSFCPKSDDNIAPDTYQKMSRALIDKLSKELIEIKFKRFEKGKHQLHLADTTYKTVNNKKTIDRVFIKNRIDGERSFGNDGEVPKKEIKSI